MDRTRLAQECADLPIFPLGGAVLLPGSVMPLHVFEPRYRTMLEDVRAGTGLMGIATVLEPSGDGSPDPVEPVVGVGLVVAHQGLPDGRSNILVQQVGILRIAEELPFDGPYRRVRGELFEPEGSDIATAIGPLRMLVLQLGGVAPGAAEEAARIAGLEGTELLDGLARRVLPAVEQRLAYLGAATLGDRVAILEDALARYVATLLPAADEV